MDFIRCLLATIERARRVQVNANSTNGSVRFKDITTNLIM